VKSLAFLAGRAARAPIIRAVIPTSRLRHDPSPPPSGAPPYRRGEERARRRIVGAPGL